MRSALQNLLLRRILATSATSNLADGLFLLGLPIVAAQTGANPFWIGALSAAQTVWWLFSIPLSTLVDRLGPGPLLLIVRPFRIVVAVVAIAVVAFPVEQQLFLLLVVAAVWGFLEVLADSAVMALPALLLGEQTYDESYALLYSTQSVTNTVLGPALGAFLIMVNTWLLFAVAALLLAVSFIIQHPLLRRSEVQPVQTETSDAASFWNDVTAGWNHIRKDRFLRAMMITLAGIVIAEEVVATVVVPYVRDGGFINNWESFIGFMRSLAGITAIGAALVAATLSRRLGRLRVMGIAAAGGMIAPLFLAVEPSVSFVLVAMVVSAVSEALWVPLAQTEMVRRTPKPLIARTRATLMFVIWGAMPVTSLLGGTVATLLGFAPALLIASSIACLAALFGIWPLAVQTSKNLVEESETRSH